MYFCKNCGEPYLSGENSICDKCGMYRYSGNRFCHNCGSPIKINDKMCQVCGVDTKNNAMSENTYFSDFKTKYQDNREWNGYYSANSGYGTETANTSSKRWIVAVILAMFLGRFGVHNFYMGYKNKAIAQLTLTIVGYSLYFLGIGIIICGIAVIWGYVDAIKLFSGKISVDGNGQSLIK